MTYRPQIAIIGGRDIDQEAQILVEDISRMLVEEGYRIVTGGLGLLPSAAHRGAKSENLRKQIQSPYCLVLTQNPLTIMQILSFQLDSTLVEMQLWQILML